MKFFLFLINSLFVLNMSNFYSEFREKVNDEYNAYKYEYEIKTDDYQIDIIKGIYKDEASYGIIFKGKNNKIELIIRQNDVRYELDKKDGYTYIIALQADSDIELYVKKGKENEKVIYGIELSTLESFDVESYNLSDKGVLIGENNATSFPALNIYKVKLVNYNAIIIVSASISFISFIAVILKIRHNIKHDPNKGRKYSEVFNYEKEEDNNEYIEAEAKVEEKEEIKDEVIDEKQYIDNLSEYLINEGFSVNYQELSDDEKNKVTVFLMKLKNTQKISNDQYLEEMYKIWKS